jgi:hypothetical protein
VKISFNTLAVVTLCSLLALLASCSTRSGGQTEEAEKQIRPLSSVVVLPAEIATEKEAAGETGDDVDLRKGAAFVDLAMAEELQDFSKVRVLSRKQIEDLMEEGSAADAVDVIDHLGRVLHSDAVLQTTVFRYRQREGGEYAVESPASASFQMRLVEVKTRAVLWSADFDETQESLLSNILAFNKAQSRGFKWVSVENLVRQGIKERIAECPYLVK